MLDFITRTKRVTQVLPVGIVFGNDKPIPKKKIATKPDKWKPASYLKVIAFMVQSLILENEFVEITKNCRILWTSPDY